MKITIAIPAYEMKGDGATMLKRLLTSVYSQTFKDYEVLVSDNSSDNEIKKMCKVSGVRYVKNPIRGMAANTNNAIKYSKGELIKILYQDDYFAHENALQAIVDDFRGTWLATGCLHNDGHLQNPHFPIFTPDLYKGSNTIGSPSVVTIKNGSDILFDENMTWVLDVDFYIRMHEKHGPPSISNDLNVVLGLHEHQTTNMLASELKRKEIEYMISKHDPRS